jgi:hypothetical protein
MKIKYSLTIVAFLITSIFATNLKAQGGFELTPFVGYTFDDTFYPYTSGYGYIDDGMAYGAIATFNVNPNLDVEFLYSRQETKGEYV